MIKRKNYLFIDGYNLINYSSKLKKIAAVDLESARKKLIDLVVEYSAYQGEITCIVFDAYQTKYKKAKEEMVGGVKVVFTKEYQTADAYIEGQVEKLAANKRNVVRVVTGDLLEQQLILGSGGYRVSPREFLRAVEQVKKNVKEFDQSPVRQDNSMESMLDENVLKILKDWRKKS